jgi:acetyl esterase/lipase
MGDSAGGGLSLLTIQALIAHQLPVPRGVIALSPWTDLSASTASYTRNLHTDVFLTTEMTHWMAKLILGPNPNHLSADNPIFSPLFGSFKGFPPMYISVGTAEIYEDDSRGVVKKAQDAGVDVTFEEQLHLMHAYPIFFPYFPEARTNLCQESLGTKCSLLFSSLNSNWRQSKVVNETQNFVLFSNMSSEMLYLFLLESSEEIFEKL